SIHWNEKGSYSGSLNHLVTFIQNTFDPFKVSRRNSQSYFVRRQADAIFWLSFRTYSAFSAHRRMKDKYKRQLYVLQGFPGIGPGRARLLLEEFGSLKAVFDALAGDCRSIPGIGEKTIRQTRQVME